MATFHIDYRYTKEDTMAVVADDSQEAEQLCRDQVFEDDEDIIMVEIEEVKKING